jgi:hypothetical protein
MDIKSKGVNWKTFELETGKGHGIRKRKNAFWRIVPGLRSRIGTRKAKGERIFAIIELLCFG